MDYYQGVVGEYLDADRSVFLNSECLIQLEPGDRPPKGTSWYCDLLAVNLRESQAYLCEVTYSTSLTALVDRLHAWDSHWSAIRIALERDCSIPREWPVTPWIFLPEERRELLDSKLRVSALPKPRITYLESVAPWKYRSWNRAEDRIDNA